ncbi:MAG: glutathione peroxidase [Vicingaceae bacterium]
MKKLSLLLLSICLITFSNYAQEMNFFDFEVNDINGESYDLSQHKGQKILVVNTASECGLTPQYETLEAVYKAHGGDDFVIIGFPANNFGGQEPGSNDEIKSFCQKNYGVSFPMMAKISVKGDDQHPLYAWLTQKSKNGVEDAPVQWNFQKFMIDEEGNYVGMVEPRESPDSETILSWVKQ